jgi:polysaccharide export outer membrane protein
VDTVLDFECAPAQKWEESVKQRLATFPLWNLRFRVGPLLFSCCVMQLTFSSPGAKAQSALAAGTRGVSESAPRFASSSSLALGVGDLVEVTVFGVPELTSRMRIGANGDIYVPLIGYVPVKDLTTDAAQAMIETRLANGYVKDPHVSVLLLEGQSQTVSILGEVTRPGKYPLTGAHTLFDVVSQAGGLTDKAGEEIEITSRDHPDQPKSVTVSRGRFGVKAESENEVNPGDTIFVSRAGVVYVVGDVARPSGLIMNDGGLTVLKAVALAGGANHGASLNKARLLRKKGDQVKETPVRLKEILAAKAPDVTMLADDVLFVPGNTGRSAALRGVDAILQTASALTVVAAAP